MSVPRGERFFVTAGAGGWSLAYSHATNAPLKPQVSCTSLVAWLDGSCLAVSNQGCSFAMFRRCRSELRLVSKWAEESLGNHQEGSDSTAGSQGIRGLALIQNAGRNGSDGSNHVCVCDSCGRIECREVGNILGDRT